MRKVWNKNRKDVMGKNGQMTIEYTVMFVVIVAVILLASKQMIQPSLNRLFNSTAKVIDNAANVIANKF